MFSVTRQRVSIIDDDQAARESVVALVRARGLEAEAYASAEEFIQSYDRMTVGCIVVDVRMPGGMSGVEFLEQFTAEGTALPMVVISGYGDIQMAVRAMQGGALTFLEKPCSDQIMWASISKALEQDVVWRERRLQNMETRDCLKRLTPDESRVLDKLLQGKPNKVIASDLDIGLRTVELRRAIILEKMHTSSLAELAQLVILAKERMNQTSVARRTPEAPRALHDACVLQGEGRRVR
jgi:two-component system, LuxR family, response regulator FixJ